ncbi:SidA/IucD/PvdA family monooxygenase [Variovorax ginsengisoli]|uniref:Cation diffusion facilitator CzcD-associated flavoprotein CzcO n=1 Tax=Variovorax ginsengisoli TaxID=363844 RepID=A0ABT9S321_9BURK|nr:NAD(P)/FAD-dependent oxidoreductase [Variovorax ginsengisoli]MDP9898750.1 cation diffusion facilitator CzcD-associated flavoprotein CzcO [Variovorax ginsengisoli]
MTHAHHAIDHLARETLRLLGPAPENWVPDTPGIDHNVAVIGGGQNGSAFAFALQRAGIGRTTVVDAAPDPSQAGVWRTRARMHKLRTPKNLVGPELGLPTLGFQAWYEARHGTDAYAALDRIPRNDWADYLDWYRGFLSVQVRYGTRLVRIEPVTHGAASHFRLHLQVGGQTRIETTRKVILANGVAGNGTPFVPAVLEEAQDSGFVSHTADAIDFDALRGRTVAVLGAAASAFDAAAVALEHGAAAVHLFARRDHLAATPIGRVRGYPGVYDNYHALPDATRWHQALRLRRYGSTPPADSVQRVLRHPTFHLHLGATWTGAAVAQSRVHTRVHGEDFAFDHVIAGTGYRVDPGSRSELVDIAPHILRWRDRFVPPDDERDDELGAAPYLGSGLEYREKTPGSAPWLQDIHLYNPGGFVSTGVPLGDVPSMRRDIPALVARINRDLVLADLDQHEKRLLGDVPADFDATLYQTALWSPARKNAPGGA